MAAGLNDDIFLAIRNQVGQNLAMAEAKSKISDDTRELLSQLILTRRSDGEVVLDVAALQRLKATDNQWTDKERNEQDRFVNPTRLPQLVTGLSGLSSAQYLAFVQRPLERNGDNGPFLEAQSLRLYDQYHDRALAQERNRLFGHSQRYIAKLLIDEVFVQVHGKKTAKELEELRNTTPPQAQFEMAAKALNITTNQVMNRMFKYAIALTVIERIKTKAIQLKKAQPKFETAMRKLANTDSGPTAKSRIKEIFIGFQKEIEQMGREVVTLNKAISPIIPQMHKDTFEESFSTLHRKAAQLDALASRWVIIFNEANNNSSVRTPVERIKGMHAIFAN